MAACPDGVAVARDSENGSLRLIVGRPDDSGECPRIANSERAQPIDMGRFHVLVVAREVRMVELKREINELCARLGEPPRYDIEAQISHPGPSPKS